MKYQFEKVFTRDTSLILLRVWYSAFTEGMSKKYDLDIPYMPPIINHVNNGSVDIYESKSAMQWFKDNLLEKNIKSEDFLSDAMSLYQKQVQGIKNLYWDKEYAESIDELESFLNDIEKAYIGFGIMFFTAIDERTPAQQQELALKTRSEDVFFDNNDKFIRRTLVEMNPSIGGLESVVLKEDINNIPEIEVLEIRKQSFIMVPEIISKSTTLEDFKKDYPNLDFYEENINIADDNSIKGSTAYKGVVRGIVRILLNKNQIDSVKEGEIIVSPMTTPDFSPAVKKALAIITDEGGITCHAAIVAREMNKPCIIGTKIATKVLKDGDLVEVDADNGIVKIIKKAE